MCRAWFAVRCAHCTSIKNNFKFEKKKKVFCTKNFCAPQSANEKIEMSGEGPDRRVATCGAPHYVDPHRPHKNP